MPGFACSLTLNLNTRRQTKVSFWWVADTLHEIFPLDRGKKLHGGIQWEFFGCMQTKQTYEYKSDRWLQYTSEGFRPEKMKGFSSFVLSSEKLQEEEEKSLIHPTFCRLLDLCSTNKVEGQNTHENYQLMMRGLLVTEKAARVTQPETWRTTEGMQSSVQWAGQTSHAECLL